MAKKGAERGEERGARRKTGNDPNRDGTLQEIEEKGQRGQILAAGAKNVGRANIAGADRAEVCSARHARQNEAERNRAANIAEQKGENAWKHVGKPFWRKGDGNLAFRRRRGNPLILLFCRAGVAPEIVSQFEFQ